jgi:rhodanese-related sulfurtransferase
MARSIVLLSRIKRRFRRPWTAAVPCRFGDGDAHAAESGRGLPQFKTSRHSERSGSDGDFILLDVRRPDERAKGFIPGSIHIPLDELRSRMSELPRDREIVVHCQSGQRSYFACRILAQHGFRVRNLTGSYRTWKTAVNRLVD